MRERRRHPRKDVNIRGLLSFDGGLKFDTCKVVNLSFGGALIRTDETARLPDTMSLFFDSPDRPLEVDVADCYVVRRGAGEAALKFLHSGAVQGVSLGLYSRVVKIGVPRTKY